MLLQELIVHSRDLFVERSRVAVVRAIASSALDIVQLRTDDGAAAVDEQEEEELEEDVVAAGRVLRLLIDRHHDLRTRPALVVNAPLTRARTILATTVRIDGWHLKERELDSLVRAPSHHHISGREARAASSTVHSQLAWLKQLQHTRSTRSPFWVGCSVHSVDAAVAAARLGVVNYLQVGTMFPTESHPEKREVEGPQLLPQIRRALVEVAADEDGHKKLRTGTRPALIAVGGIATADHVREVMAAGADGIAVIRAVLRADDPRDAATRMRAVMERAAATREPKTYE